MTTLLLQSIQPSFHLSLACLLPSAGISSRPLYSQTLRCGLPTYCLIRTRSGGLAYDAVGDQVRCSFNNESGSSSTSDEEGSSPQTNKDVEGPWYTSSPKAVSEVVDGDGHFVLEDSSLLQTRRFWLGTSLVVLLALGGNLAGVTSSILTLRPELSRSVRADLLFPVKGFKRCLETTYGFEFTYPSSWVGDQRLLYRAVARAERERSLDLPPLERRPLRRTSTDPVVAFGPPGTDGELNVSVVVAPVYPGFTLEKIGGPQEAGELILKQFIAPEGSKKVASLLNAQRRGTENQFYYTLEFSVRGPTFFRHNLAVYTASSGLLYSLNVQTSERAWETVQADSVEIANSFRLLV